MHLIGLSGEIILMDRVFFIWYTIQITSMKIEPFHFLNAYLILSTVTDASFGASSRAASCSRTFCTWVSSIRGFFAADSPPS